MEPAGRERKTPRVVGESRSPFAGASGPGRSSSGTPGRRDDDEVREIEQLAPAVPCGKTEERVGADEQRERRRGVLLSQLRQRVAPCSSCRRVRSRACRARVPGTRRSASSSIATRSRGRRTRRRAMRRITGRNEPHLRQRERRARRRRRAAGARSAPDRTCRRGSRAGAHRSCVRVFRSALANHHVARVFPAIRRAASPISATIIGTSEGCR